MSNSFSHRLLRFLKPSLKLPAYFDPDWYLETYHDVKASGMDPWLHFDRHGRSEGRFACQAHAEIWPLKQNLLQVPKALSSDDQCYWAWLLGRWYAKCDDWPSVYQAMQSYIFALDTNNPYENQLMPGVLWYEALMRMGFHVEAEALLVRLKHRYPDSPIFSFLAANACLQRHDEASRCWLKQVNSLYQGSGLSSISLVQNQLSFDSLTGEGSIASVSDVDDASEQAVVSVIIPAYNSEFTLPTVLRGLGSQSWKNLDIIVVDDGSTDKTVDVAASFAQQDARIRVVHNHLNQGPYVVRNQGLNLARGEFITVHDADDWSHPQKIELQVLPLLASDQLQATQSYWARLTDSLYFGGWQTPSSWAGLCHRNTSSLLFRRSVFGTLGYWDQVSCNADMEYYHRILRAFGSSAIQEVLPNIPLSMGRMSSNSITQRSDTSIFTIFSGARCDYTHAYMQWHLNAGSPDELYLPQYPQQRPFPAPPELLNNQSS